MSLVFVGHPKETDLALFAGGELGPLARWRIERHLQRCEWCRETVADFFHLQGDLAELAELPSLDWDEMAHQIRERLEEPAPLGEDLVTEASVAESPVQAPVRPLVWRLGFAMAAVVSVAVVVYQIPRRPEPNMVAEPMAELSHAMPRRAVPAEEALRGSVESRTELEASLKAADEADLAESVGVSDRGGVSLGAALVSESDSRSGRRSDTRELIGAGEQLEVKEESAGARARTLPGDRARPTVPGPAEQVAAYDRAPAAAPRQKSEQSAELRSEGSAVSSDETAGQTMLADAIGPVGANERQLRKAPSPRRAFSSPGMTVTGGLSIVPASFGEADVEVGVSADGWLRFRTVDSTTGNITITHVYAQ